VGPRTAAALVVETLAAHGVRRLFTLSGNHVLSLYDATLGREVALLHTRHEAAAVHMADAWGRLTGEPGVAVVTGGPGHLNAVAALMTARESESPVVLLSGHCPLAEVGRGAFQEVDQVAAARPVTKGAWLAEDPARIGEDIARAMALAVEGRPGPVHVSLPADVLETPAPEGAPAGRRPGPRREPAAAALDELLALVAGADRPLIVAGPAMARGAAWDALRALADALGVPAIPSESPRGVNDPWLRAAARELARADVVLLVGKRLDFSLRFGRPPAFAAGCRFARLDVDAAAAEGIALAVAADPALAVERLAERARARSWPRRPWRGEVLARRAAVPPEWEAHRTAPGRPLRPLAVCAAIQPWLDRGGILVSDGGEFGQWCQAALEAETRLINGPAGSIGSALPMAVAARLARPDRLVVATLGDGTFGFHALEFDTAVREGLPFVAVVGNDARWNAEHQLQVRQYGAARAVGCDLLPTRYDRLVEALGGVGLHVDDPADLPSALERAVASGRPACVDVTIDGAPAPTFR
jgi:acetolactate synthase-1/2/3 large subunit